MNGLKTAWSWLVAGAMLACAAAGAAGAPFAQWFEARTGDGGTVRVWGEGNEYDAHFETAEGRTVLFNPQAGRYEYADRTGEDGALAGIGVFVGDESGNEERLARTELHLRDTSEAHRAEVEARWRERDEGMGLSRRWNEVKAATARIRSLEERRAKGLYKGPIPKGPLEGEACGVTLLVDFPLAFEPTNTLGAVHGERPAYGREYMLGLLNGEGWREDGNYSSVRDFYYEISKGKFVYTNVCSDWIVAPHSREYYDNVSESDGNCGRWLVRDILETMKKDPQFDTKYLPLLEAATLSESNTVRALNVLFTGGPASTWGHGLWAHSSALDETQWKMLRWTNDAGAVCHFQNFQITPLFSDTNVPTPVIGTLCHEDGHMICGFPDYYHYTKKNNGAGWWSLMNSGNHLNYGRSPCGIDAYTRLQAGWATPMALEGDEGWISINDSRDNIYKFTNPTNRGEYFLIENRQKRGCDRALLHGGIQIWRCREGTNNIYASEVWGSIWTAYSELTTPAWRARKRWTGELYMEQADGCYGLEGGDEGDANDVWFAGNTAKQDAWGTGTGYTGKWNDDTAACSRWYDATESGLALSWFSPTGYTMRVYVGKEGPRLQTVTFDPNGGEVDVATETYPLGGCYSYGKAFPVPSRLGYDFAGWYATTNFLLEILATNTVESGLARTLHAKWTGKTYAVELDRQGGEGGTTMVMAWMGSGMPAIEAPKRAGYAFGGYFLFENGEGTQYYAADGSSAHVWDQADGKTLYAKWTAVPYRLDFNDQGGTSGMEEAGPLYVTLGAAMPTEGLRLPVMENHEFTGYFERPGGEGAQYYSAAGLSARAWDRTEDATLYAGWRGVPCRIAFDFQGGQPGADGRISVTARYGETPPDLDWPPVREGWVFCGFFTGPDGTGTQVYSGTGRGVGTWRRTEDTTVYAFWADRPSNDRYGEAADLGTAPGGTAFGSNAGAGAESGEPLARHLDGVTPASVWWKWTPPFAGTVWFDTAGSVAAGGEELDTLLSASGNYPWILSLSSLRETAFNDDSGREGWVGHRISHVDFEVAGDGETYGIAVCGKTATDQGDIRLSWGYDRVWVALDAGEGTAATNRVLVRYGFKIGAETVAALPKPVRRDWVFRGWFDAAGKAVAAETVVAGNDTWTAAWTELLPVLPDDASADEVRAALDDAGLADPAVAAVIGGDAAKYNDFVAWVDEVFQYGIAGREGVCGEAYACISWLLGQSYPLSVPFEIRILRAGIVPATATNATGMTLDLGVVEEGGMPLWGDYRRLGYAIFGASDLLSWGENRVAVEASPVTTGTYGTNGIFRVLPKEAAERVFLRVGEP